MFEKARLMLTEKENKQFDDFLGCFASTMCNFLYYHPEKEAEFSYRDYRKLAFAALETEKKPGKPWPENHEYLSCYAEALSGYMKVIEFAYPMIKNEDFRALLRVDIKRRGLDYRFFNFDKGIKIWAPIAPSEPRLPNQSWTFPLSGHEKVTLPISKNPKSSTEKRHLKL